MRIEFTDVDPESVEDAFTILVSLDSTDLVVFARTDFYPGVVEEILQPDGLFWVVIDSFTTETGHCKSWKTIDDRGLLATLDKLTRMFPFGQVRIFNLEMSKYVFTIAREKKW